MSDYGHTSRRKFYMEKKSKGLSAKKLNIFIISSIVISTVMTSAIAAPTRHRHQKTKIYLNNSCSADHVNGDARVKGHSGIAQLQTQINITIGDYKEINETYIAETYESITDFSSQIVDHQLPRDQFNEYKAFREKKPRMGKDRMISKLLPKLFHRLYIYGMAFKKLYDMKPHTDSAAYMHERRTDVMRRMIDKHRALVCEVETAFNDFDTKNKTKAHRYFNSDIYWPDHPDLTTINSRDFSVFTAYINFLKDWQKILRQVDSIGKHRNPEKKSLQRRIPNKNGVNRNHRRRNLRQRKAHRQRGQNKV